MSVDIAKLNDRIREESSFVTLLKSEVGKVIVGQSRMIDRLLIGLLCRGHILLEGCPGTRQNPRRLNACKSHRYRFPQASVYPRSSARRPCRNP